MAEGSGITEVALKEKITAQLQATHVEIEDMSGMFTWLIFYPTSTPPLAVKPRSSTTLDRREFT
jgi:hypothetical protein